MTVAMYQGDNAEAEWQQHISTVSVLRHPNLVQIYGAANSSGMYATVFHDGQHAPVKARGLTFLKDMEWDCSATCTLWIRSSTRRLCADLACGHGPMSPDLTAIPSFYYNPPAYSRFQNFGRVLMRRILLHLNVITPNARASVGFFPLLWRHKDSPFISVGYCPHNTALPGTNGAVLVEGRLMDAEFGDVRVEQKRLTVKQRELSLSVSSQEPVKLGAVISYSASSQLQTPIEIACLAEDELEIKEQDWIMEDGEEIVSDQMVDGWTRSCDAVGRMFVRTLADQGRSWLSQATHIFNRLQVTSGHENYGASKPSRFITFTDVWTVLVHQVELRLAFSQVAGLSSLLVPGSIGSRTTEQGRREKPWIPYGNVGRKGQGKKTGTPASTEVFANSTLLKGSILRVRPSPVILDIHSISCPRINMHTLMGMKNPTARKVWELKTKSWIQPKQILKHAVGVMKSSVAKLVLHERLSSKGLHYCGLST
ncbi:hypothetical protein C8R43DRAFT_953102 [Mycena crocata]|nr:hypothetical protein C8R43DRAFT_953102 [Mycena crocata]